MNLTSILPTSGAEKRKVDRGAGTDTRPQQSSCHESTGHITARLSSFNLSGGGTQHLAAWVDESQRNAQESPVRHFGSRNRKYGIKTAQQPDLFEPTLNIGEQGMPRTKRRASTTANNHSSSEMPQSNTEDAPRHPSKRLRHTSSSRRRTRADDGAAAAATAAASAPHHHQQHYHQHHTHHHHQQQSFQQPSFSQKRCVAWFREYTTPDEPESLGPEGMEKFCEDIGVEPENVVMLVLAYKMGARQMGFFSLNEWLKGLTGLQCDSIAKLQSRMDYLRNLLNDPNTFKGIYRYAYDFARDKDQRSMDMETARVMLQLLLGKHWSLFSQFAKFLDQSKYKVINKDQWCNILEFSRTICDDLSNYDLDGAWPVMLDEFVEWLKAQQDGGVNQMDTRTS